MKVKATYLDAACEGHDLVVFYLVGGNPPEDPESCELAFADLPSALRRVEEEQEGYRVCIEVWLYARQRGTGFDDWDYREKLEEIWLNVLSQSAKTINVEFGAPERPIGDLYSNDDQRAPKVDVDIVEFLEFDPDYVSPPGSSVMDALEEKGWTLDIVGPEIKAVVKEQAPITPEIAEALELLTKAPADFWLRRQEQYDKRRQDSVDC